MVSKQRTSVCETKNEYFDDVLFDTFGEEKIIYNIRTFNSKKRQDTDMNIYSFNFKQKGKILMKEDIQNYNKK